ncbi:hypothetical protein SESBI_40611 [Sesbania bispinosa]|nr:hypothetical protein SESBI_40611 [Sesbania bispinosa]
MVWGQGGGGIGRGSRDGMRTTPGTAVARFEHDARHDDLGWCYSERTETDVVEAWHVGRGAAIVAIRGGGRVVRGPRGSRSWWRC